MKLSELVDRLVIDSRKLTAYALNPYSPRGKDKAVVFKKALGYTIDNYKSLLRQLETKPLDCEVIPHGEDHFGKRYTVDVTIIGAAGQQAIVRTGWLVPPAMQEAHLMTLYVKKR